MESLAFNVAEKVLGRLASHAYQEISLALGVNAELNKLKETLETITILLLDAEEKQIKDRRITHWLGKLKDVCYDADDVLDEFEFQKLQTQVLNLGSIKGKVRKFFFSNKMGHRIKDIRERLDEIDDEKNKFSLSEQVGYSQGVHVERETHSYVQALDVIGRDKDEEHIITHLLEDNISQSGENISVVSVMGLGGLGKTTLAKLVYNNNRIIENFHLRMWVCVSDNFDTKKLICDIIRSATGQNYGDESLDQMQIELRGVLRNKKFLLVLDDVWDKEPMGVTNTKWVGLKSLLNVGGSGSKVIVTTRSGSVALLAGSMYMHPLKGLPHKDSVTLFKKLAFGKGSEERKYPQLMKVVDDIVKKCGGVPLALTTVGSLLYLTKDLHEWLRIRDDDNWKLKDDGILPALRLSYDALPSYLKPCFAYCSLFPKDYEFRSMQLIAMWVAEGFLQSSDGNQGFEEMGLGYIRQLCSRFLFQKVDKNPMFSMSFKMHDLVHDLAISMTQAECSSINFRPSNGSERIRHVSISSKELSKEVLEHATDFILQLDKVRTLIIPDPNDFEITNQSFLKTCISRFNYLRVLDFSSSNLKAVPSSIGNLSHLRYLNLCDNRIIELPDSICKLHKLQTLLLQGCNRLQELPKEIGNLISLINLVVTTKQKYLPKELGSLTSLQYLSVTNCVNLKSFGEGIQYLANLRKLHIQGCDDLESLPRNMKDLTALEYLFIDNCVKLDMESGEGIPSLRLFSINNPYLQALPHWLRHSANSLEGIHIKGCWNLSMFPEWLRDLASLQRIEISNCSPELGGYCFNMARAIEITVDGELLNSEYCMPSTDSV